MRKTIRTTFGMAVWPVKMGMKTYYNVPIAEDVVWVHKSLIENDLLLLKGNRFYLDIYKTSDGLNSFSTYYLYPGENKIALITSMEHLHIVNASKWLILKNNSIFYYLIEYNEDKLIVQNEIETFEISNNRIINVKKHMAYGNINNSIDGNS